LIGIKIELKQRLWLSKHKLNKLKLLNLMALPKVVWKQTQLATAAAGGFDEKTFS
jgi:hypothetical protein